MRKKLIFVIESLTCAGAEKSLVTLLNKIDYSKYDVDLQLFSYGGEFEALLPEEVNLLPKLDYFSFADESLKSIFKLKKNKFNIKMLLKRLQYSIMIRTKSYSNPEKAVLFWKIFKTCFSTNIKEYDVAIAYAQCVPTFYVSDCVKANKKIAWVNAIYTPKGRFKDYNILYYYKYNNIICVSNNAYDIFNKHFPEISDKTSIIYDINDSEFILKMSNIESKASEEMNYDGLKILTVGRLAEQKGYDIAIGAGALLRNKKIDFKWYILGKGPLEKKLKEEIENNSLEDNFVFLGTRYNPYPYYKNADIYVQTSKFEGFGLAIAEARMLNIPVVTTCFSAVSAQMINKQNGLVVDMDSKSVADGIELLFKDKDLYEHIKNYQRLEKHGNADEIIKFYDILGDKNEE